MQHSSTCSVSHLCVFTDNHSDEHNAFTLFSSRQQSCTLTLSAAHYYYYYAHTHTLAHWATVQMKHDCGSCGGASQDACVESWRQSSGPAGLWGYGASPRGPSLPDSSELWTRSPRSSVSNQGYHAWARCELWVGFVGIVWTWIWQTSK